MSRGRQAERRMREQERLSGIMPMTRELGDLLERDAVPELVPIDMPRRPYLGHYSPEARAEMQAIWNTPDPFEAGPIARRLNQESEFDDAN